MLCRRIWSGVGVLCPLAYSQFTRRAMCFSVDWRRLKYADCGRSFRKKKNYIYITELNIEMANNEKNAAARIGCAASVGV